MGSRTAASRFPARSPGGSGPIRLRICVLGPRTRTLSGTGYRIMSMPRAFFPRYFRLHPMKWCCGAGFLAAVRQTGMAMGRQPRHGRSCISGHRRLRSGFRPRDHGIGRVSCSSRRWQDDRNGAMSGQHGHPRHQLLGPQSGLYQPVRWQDVLDSACLVSVLPESVNTEPRIVNTSAVKLTNAVELYSSTPVCTLRRLRQARSSVG